MDTLPTKTRPARSSSSDNSFLGKDADDELRRLLGSPAITPTAAQRQPAKPKKKDKQKTTSIAALLYNKIAITADAVFSSLYHQYAPAAVKRRVTATRRAYNDLLDKLNPYILQRWIITLFLFVIYIIRSRDSKNGFFVVTYIVCVFYLTLLVDFISPLVDYDDDEDEDEDPANLNDLLPQKASDEWKPFVRKLPEFKYWSKTTFAISLAIMATFSQYLDIPVYWPLLLVYFVIAFAHNLKERFQDMQKHHYVPFNTGKFFYRN